MQGRPEGRLFFVPEKRRVFSRAGPNGLCMDGEGLEPVGLGGFLAGAVRSRIPGG